MVGFFDLPFELRDMIWSHAAEDLNQLRISDGALVVVFPAHGAKAYVLKRQRIQWQWLAAVSRTSRAFSQQGRHLFFRTMAFSITEPPKNAYMTHFVDTPGTHSQFAGLSGFLQWAGTNASLIQHPFAVTHPYRRSEGDWVAALNELDVMNIGRYGVQTMKIDVCWAASGYQRPPILHCRSNANGLFEFVAGDLSYSRPDPTNSYSWRFWNDPH